LRLVARVALAPYAGGVKSAAALLLALFALTGSVGVRAPLGACGALAVRCTSRPCCKPASQDMPTVRARMACCEVARVAEQQLTPAVSRPPAPGVLVAVLDAPLALPPVAPARVAHAAPSLAPRGPPIYLRNRSLLL